MRFDHLAGLIHKIGAVPDADKTSIRILQEAAEVAENNSCPQCLYGESASRSFAPIRGQRFPLRFLCVIAVGHVVAPLQRGDKHRAGTRCWRERDRPGTSAAVRARWILASPPSRCGRRGTSPASSRHCACRARHWRRRRSPSPGRPAALCPRSSPPTCLP